MQAIGSYRIVDRLGRGGMGTVYRAVDDRNGRTVALKVLAEELAAELEGRRRFMRESKVLASNDSDPRIVSLQEVIEENGVVALAMELVEGPNLEELIRKEGPLTERIALDYLLQAVDGFERMAARGFVHRDVKPANLLVDRERGIKITDFGIARCMNEATRLTKPDTVMGSPAFMAPEQVRGAPDIDHRSDIYSLGATLHYMLAGKPPFDAPHTAAMIMCQINDPPPDVSVTTPGTTARTAKLVQWMLAKDRADRPATYAALRKEAEACLSMLGTASGKIPRPAERPASGAVRPSKPAESTQVHGPRAAASGSGTTATPAVAARAAANPGIIERLSRRIRVKAAVACALLVFGAITLSGPPGMVFVPAGTYEMTAGKHPRKVHVDSPFWIDRYEVTEAEFARFDTTHSIPRDREGHPVTNVKDAEARNYAERAGKRLPTDAEWEAAARGPQAFVYPWGNDVPKGAANLKENAEGGTRPVGSFSTDKSSFGCYDMAGNVREYTWNGVRTNVAGGSYRENIDENLLDPPTSYWFYHLDEVGFRCVKDHGILVRLGHALVWALLFAAIAYMFWRF